MAISSVYNQYGLSISSLYQQTMNESGGSSTSSSGISGSGASLYTSTMASTKGQASLSKALAAIKSEKGSDRITFDDVEAYRNKLEEDFSAKLKEDLLKLGVDPDVEFTLVTDSSGRLNVVSDHPDKAKIQQYFDANPGMAEQFETIQSLSNFKRSAESPQVRDWDSMRELKKGLQAQAIEIFFATAQEATGFSPMYADYSGETNMVDYMFGINTTV